MLRPTNLSNRLRLTQYVGNQAVFAGELLSAKLLEAWTFAAPPMIDMNPHNMIIFE